MKKEKNFPHLSWKIPIWLLCIRILSFKPWIWLFVPVVVKAYSEREGSVDLNG